jgi:uncharacterized protein
MRLSREKINHLSRIIIKELKDCPNVAFLREDNDVRLRIVKVITDELKVDDAVDTAVRKTLASYTKKILEGSREWDVMYQKLYEEEMNRRRRY